MSELDADPARPDAATAGSAFDRLEHLDVPAGSAAAPSANTEGRAPVAAPQLTRRGRLRKWDRPKPPRDWRWWVGNVGKALIATGLLMFGFVAYQLWGTGIETARAQNQLENEFDALLAEAPPVVAPDFAPGENTPTVTTPIDETDIGTGATPPEPSVPAPTAPSAGPVETPAIPVKQQNIGDLDNGDALARLEIPRIGRNDIVVAGVRTSDLKRGPGHFPDTPLPGQLGNAAIAGHRTTYGSPFFDVDKLEVGDEIIATTLNGRYTYRVTGQQIVASSDYWVVATTDPTRATLTLTSCHPKYTAEKRIVIFSELVASESAAVGEPVLNYGRVEQPTDDSNAPENAIDADVSDTALPAETATNGATEPDVDDPATNPASGGVSGNVGDVAVAGDATPLSVGEVSDAAVDAFSDGWFSDPGANGQVALWGLLLSLVSVAAYAVSRRLRRDWAGALIGIVPFVVTLYFFFQNVNRLLPPNL